jgi:hypothetical protein
MVDLLINTAEFTVTYIVPAVVWTMLSVGLVQMVASKLHLGRVRPVQSRQLARHRGGAVGR